MSALPGPILPQSSPQTGTPGPFLQPEPAARRWWVMAGLAIILLLVALAWWRWPVWRAKPSPVASIRTVKVIRGVLEQTLRLTGSTTAKKFATVFSPRVQAPDSGMAMVLLYLADSGTKVKKGEVIARIDGRAVQDHLDDVEAQVNQSALDLIKLKSQQAAETEAARQAVRAAKAALDSARQDMLALDVKSRIDQEVLKLTLEEAQAAYTDARRELPLLAERQHADLRIAEIQQAERISHRNRHRADVARFTIHAPIDGVVVLKSIRRQGELAQVRQGDQLAPGQPFLRVVDLSGMYVDATINQTDIQLLHLGQPATIQFDAYPGMVMRGKVESVGALAVATGRMNQWVHSIPVRISIEGNDPRLLPDLTASADVVVGEYPDSLLLPREAVQEKDGKPLVYVKEGDSLLPREVEIGASNATQVSVTAGLSEGDQVAIQPQSGI
jgi:HlyD family secretion protein